MKNRCPISCLDSAHGRFEADNLLVAWLAKSRLELFGRSKSHLLAGLDPNALTGRRITSHARGAVFDPKDAESAHTDVWLAYRLHSLSAPVPVSWSAVHGQFDAGFQFVRHLKPLPPSPPAVPRAEAKRLGLG